MFYGVSVSDSTVSNQVSQAEFARLLGVDRAYVTRLKHDGRLVMNGGKVLVAESRARIEATQGERDDLRERHAAARGRAGDVQPPAPPPAAPPAAAEPIDSLARAAHVLKLAKAREGLAQAQIREMERDKLAGSLLAREDVEQALADVGAMVRAELDALPDQLAPQLAAVSDPDEAHALLAAHCRNSLLRLAELLRKKRGAQ